MGTQTHDSGSAAGLVHWLGRQCDWGVIDNRALMTDQLGAKKEGAMWSAAPELERNGYIFELGEYEAEATKYNVLPDIHVEDYILNS
jgi:hypothetical protein